MYPRTMNLLSTLTLLAFALLPSVFAEEVSNSTVPEECKTICNPIVQLTNTCDVDPMNGMDMDMDMKKRSDQEELVEADCICNNTSFDVKSVMGLCASCMGQNAGSGNKTAVEGMKFFSTFMFARGA